MLKFLISPLARLSAGLVMLTLSLLLTGDMLGMVPNTRNAQLESRKIAAESTAVLLSSALNSSQKKAIDDVLYTLVERNDSVLSAGVRRSSGDLLSHAGNHRDLWTPLPTDRSTARQIQVPLHDGQKRWGILEIRFRKLHEKTGSRFWQDSFLAMFILVGVGGFIGYLLFLKRSLRELDPSSVIPDRVQTALDTLSEGLLIINKDAVIVFSNKAFAQISGIGTNQLIGMSIGSLYWQINGRSPEKHELPWFNLLQDRDVGECVLVQLIDSTAKVHALSVRVSPVSSGKTTIDGILITFDNVTRVEEKNAELQLALNQLEHTQKEIKRQNRELHILATRDPLTGVLNRRAFFEGFEEMLVEANESGSSLSCIMVDIDHFKSVNDTYGHAAGDEVIKYLAQTLTDKSQAKDLVGRFGGEEFCVVLPGIERHMAAQIADNMRAWIEHRKGATFDEAIRITSSFGVSELSDGIDAVAVLVDCADKALYAAKEGGRNRVVIWTGSLDEELPTDPDALPDSELKPMIEGAASAQVSSAGKSDHESQSDVVGRMLDSVENLPLVESSDPEASGLQTLLDEPHGTTNHLLFDRIEQAMIRSTKSGTLAAVLVVGLENIDLINDGYGYTASEKALTSILKVIRSVLRGTDFVEEVQNHHYGITVSRLGRNEIVIVLSDLMSADKANVIVERLLDATSVPVVIEGNAVLVNVVVGVSLYPVHGDTADSLLGCAASAMGGAEKLTSRYRYQVYTAEDRLRTKHILQLERDIRKAIERREFSVVYQPKLDMRSGVVKSMEALLRWNHPTLGSVSPEIFIAMAESNGCIREISSFLWRTVCSDIAAWRAAGISPPCVAMNTSPIEFQYPAMGDNILATLAEHDIPAHWLEMEITESLLIQNLDKAISILGNLSRHGLSIAIDDFGKGYSSLSYLKTLPLNKIKIDRAFISRIEEGSKDASIVSAIVAMAHGLECLVVAEGVETIEQMRLLRELGCDEIQGYLVSKPISGKQLCDQLKRKQGSIHRFPLVEEVVDLLTTKVASPDIYGVFCEFSSTDTTDSNRNSTRGDYFS